MKQTKLANALQNKLDTSVWCRQMIHESRAHSFRSPELQPPLSGGSEFHASGLNLITSLHANLALEERQMLVTDVCAKRRRLVARMDLDERQAERGRILLFSPDQSLYDGAAESESDGFFDFYNVPAWDTWILYVEDNEQRSVHFPEWTSYLACWIPADIIEIIKQSIDVNPERCLRWAKDIQTPLAQELSNLDI